MKVIDERILVLQLVLCVLLVEEASELMAAESTSLLVCVSLPESIFEGFLLHFREWLLIHFLWNRLLQVEHIDGLDCVLKIELQ